VEQAGDRRTAEALESRSQTEAWGMTGYWRLRRWELAVLVFVSMVLGFSISALLPPYPTGGLRVSSYAVLAFAQICMIIYILRAARLRS
jgi:4-hydroxybenzoate polyprenyltransferase